MKAPVLFPLLTLCISLWAAPLTAMDLGEFEKIANALEPSGFGAPSEVCDEDGELIAIFQKGKQFLRMKAAPGHRRARFDNPYLFEGHSAEFASIDGQSILIVYLKALDTLLTIHSNSLSTKAELEDLTRKTGLLTKLPAAVAWPSEIPQNQRVAGRVLRVEKDPSQAEGYSTDYTITMLMSPELRKSFDAMLSKEEHSGGYLFFKDQTTLSHNRGEIEDLSRSSSDGDKVVFTYSIP